MKVRLIAVYVNNDIYYDVCSLIDNCWILNRSFKADQRALAISYVNDLKMIEPTKYDRPLKFPNTILVEV